MERTDSERRVLEHFEREYQHSEIQNAPTLHCVWVLHSIFL